jgi:hypothetical protein
MDGNKPKQHSAKRRSGKESYTQAVISLPASTIQKANHIVTF